MPEKRSFKHLSRSVVPLNYTLQFHPDLQNFSFTGCGEIEVDVSIYDLSCAFLVLIYLAKDETRTKTFPSRQKFQGN